MCAMLALLNCTCNRQVCRCICRAPDSSYSVYCTETPGKHIMTRRMCACYPLFLLVSRYALQTQCGMVRHMQAEQTNQKYISYSVSTAAVEDISRGFSPLLPFSVVLNKEVEDRSTGRSIHSSYRSREGTLQTLSAGESAREGDTGVCASRVQSVDSPLHRRELKASCAAAWQPLHLLRHGRPVGVHPPAGAQ